MYPSSSLTIITPIVFFVMLFAFPIIGVFAGWKRAAYWGGGNFLFYCIGLIIWNFAGPAISSSLTAFIKGLLPSQAQSADFTQILKSAVGPIFFIIYMLIVNLVLLVCYYTFVKRLLGIKQDKIAREEAKKAQSQKGSVAVKTTKGSVVNTRWFNMVVGGVGLTALMLPITLSTTHAVAMTTTSTSTRKSNGLTAALYNGLQTTSKNVGIMSYYNGENTGKDYDALFSVVALSSKEIEYYDPATETVSTANPITAMTTSVSHGIECLITQTKNSGVTLETSESIQPLVNAIDNFTMSWDRIMMQVGEDINIALNSSGVTTIIESMFPSMEKIKVTDELVLDKFLAADSVFVELKDAYVNGHKETQKDKSGNDALYVLFNTDDGEENYFRIISYPIAVSQDAYDVLVNTVFNMFDTSNLSQTSIDGLKQVSNHLISMIAYVSE